MSEPSSPSPPSAEVADLARAFGVATEYYTQQGARIEVDGETLTRVLTAIHVDASTPSGRAAAWDRVTNGPWRRVLPHVVVARQGHPRQFHAHVPEGTALTAWVELEQGGRHPLAHTPQDREAREVDGRMMRQVAFDVPSDLPLGWHTIRATDGTRNDDEPSHECVLVVTPERLEMPAAIRDRRTWGLMAQLYATRSRA